MHSKFSVRKIRRSKTEVHASFVAQIESLESADQELDCSLAAYWIDTYSTSSNHGVVGEPARWQCQAVKVARRTTVRTAAASRFPKTRIKGCAADSVRRRLPGGWG